MIIVPKPYAARDGATKRRQYEETNLNKYRSNFGQDRDRIIESNAFRKLQYKTQVFVNFHGDLYRTRLTHSLEVGQIARWIASGLSLNKDLAEIISLAHDLGHPPFGHAGEDALNHKITEYDPLHVRFSHNAQAIKVVTHIENRFVDHRGLNLCWDTLEGPAKHNGPFLDPKKMHPIISSYNQEFDLKITKQPSLEAQVSSLSDDIAYNNHDMEDGLKDRLFSIEDLLQIDQINDIYQEIASKYTNIKQEQMIGEIKKILTSKMVIDLIENSKIKLAQFDINSLDSVRNFDEFLIEHSKEMKVTIRQIGNFLYKNMYMHDKVDQMRKKAGYVISILFDHYLEFPNQIPEQFKSSQQDLITSICDYISGMTDRYAINEFNKIKNNDK